MIFQVVPFLDLIVSVDREAAQETIRAIRGMVTANPMLSDRLDILRNGVVNRQTGAEVRVTSSDVASSFAYTPAEVHADEVDKWVSQELFESLLTACLKSGGRLVATGNALAARPGDWKRKTFAALVEKADKEPEFWAMRTSGVDAPWLAQEQDSFVRNIADLFPQAHRRLFLNEDTDAVGDFCITEQIAACEHTEIPEQQDAPRTGEAYHLGVDLGLKKDSAAVALLAVQPGIDPVFRLAAGRVFAPPPGGVVSIDEIERYLRALIGSFRPAGMTYDRWNAAQLAEHLKGSVELTEFGNSGEAGTELAVQFYNAVSQGRFWFNPETAKTYDPKLKTWWTITDDLQSLNLETKANGVKLAAARIGQHHGDLSMRTCWLS